MIKWIFFDVGNVILNDDPAMAFYYNEIFKAIQEQGNNVTLDRLLKDREHSILNERNGRHYIQVALKYLDRENWSKYEPKIMNLINENWATLSPLMPDIVSVIKSLSRKYQLGIIANQPKITEQILRRHDLLKYFQVLGISQAVDLFKPDPEFFRWAIKQAGCLPEEAIMVGDRIDHDIKPARAVGMKTIWFPILPDIKGWEPQAEFEKKYYASLQRACVSHLMPTEETEIPDTIARDFGLILVEVERLKYDPESWANGGSE
jgi:HAD superfamily hydrolase (TIGR01662 family)